MQLPEADRNHSLDLTFLPGSVGTYSNHGFETSSTPEGESEVQKINQDRGSIEYPLAGYEQALFCVFDGHGPDGADVAEEAMITVHTSVLENISKGPQEALTVAFSVAEESLKKHRKIMASDSGTTAVAVIMRGAELYLAHVGDSRAVVGRRVVDGTIEPVQLTKDHTPYCEKEAAKVKERGGVCMPELGGWPSRVVMFIEHRMHSMMMTRSLGDFKFKDKGGISAEPEHSRHTVSSGDVCMVIASDGVWEMMSNEEVLACITQEGDAGDACKRLIEEATRQWAEKEGSYRDDITATVIWFPCLSPEPDPKAPSSPFLSGISGRRSILVEDCTPRNSTLRDSGGLRESVSSTRSPQVSSSYRISTDESGAWDRQSVDLDPLSGFPEFELDPDHEEAWWRRRSTSEGSMRSKSDEEPSGNIGMEPGAEWTNPETNSGDRNPPQHPVVAEEGTPGVMYRRKSVVIAPIDKSDLDQAAFGMVKPPGPAPTTLEGGAAVVVDAHRKARRPSFVTALATTDPADLARRRSATCPK